MGYKKYLLSAVLLATTSAVAQAQERWDWSSFPGEESRAVMGCADSGTDEDWSCLVVRCEAPGDLGLYVELSDFEIPGASTIRIGAASFPVTGSNDTGEAPYTTRLQGNIGAIVSALASGNTAIIARDRMPITPGFDTIHLRGSSAALTNLQASCQGASTVAAGDMLPLRHGIYVDASIACTGLSHATTLSFWGDQLNAQRVVGQIQNVSGSAPNYVVTLDATDLAEEDSLGILEWSMRIGDRENFTLTDSSPATSYRWCYDAMP